MSIISFLEKLTGIDIDGSDKAQTVVERPCANCPSNCAIAGDACSICQPYKKRLIDWVYHVDHLDEFRAQYEVVTQTQATSGGVTHCPRCGAGSSDPYVCEYCGSQLAEKPASSGKIQVSAASEIPNPIMEAQNVIYERYEAVIKQYASQNTQSGGFLSNLFSELTGSGDDDNEESALGAKMSEGEITEAAGLYNVSVGEYLTGLDNGKYMTLAVKKAMDSRGSSSYAPESAGLSGMAGIGMLAGSLISKMNQTSGMYPQQSYSRNAPVRPSQPQYRPSSSSQRQPSGSQELFDKLSDLNRPSSSGSTRRPPEPQRPSSDTQAIFDKLSDMNRQSSSGSSRRAPEPQRQSSGSQDLLSKLSDMNRQSSSGSSRRPPEPQRSQPQRPSSGSNDLFSKLSDMNRQPSGSSRSSSPRPSSGSQDIANKLSGKNKPSSGSSLSDLMRERHPEKRRK